MFYKMCKKQVSVLMRDMNSYNENKVEENKQHQSNISSWIHEKVQQYWGWVWKKKLAH